MDQDTSNTSGKTSWRERLGIAPAGTKDLPKLSDEFQAQKPAKPAPKLAAVKEPKPVTKPAPMAPRNVNSAGLRPVQPAPKPVMPNQSLAERLRAEREAAEKLAKQRIAQARGKADGAPAEPSAKPQVNGQANGKPKFSFADDELQQAKREVQTGRDFPGLSSQRAAQPQQPSPLIPPRPMLGGAPSMPPLPNRVSSFQPRPGGSPQGQIGGYRPLDPPSVLAKQQPPQQRDAHAMPQPRRPAPLPQDEQFDDGFEDAPPRRQPARALDSHRRRPPQPYEGNGYYDDSRHRPAPARGRQPAYDGDMDEVFEDDPRPQQQQPRRKASAQEYNQVYREYEGFDEPRRSRSGPWLLLSILLVGILLSGGILYYYMNFMNKPGGSSAQGEVPVIAAPEQPAKSEPLAPDGTDLSAKGSAQQPAETRRKQIYDRILGDEEVSGNQMMPTEEQPKLIEPLGGQPSNQPGQGTSQDGDTLPLPLPPPGDQGAIGTNSNQQIAALSEQAAKQIPEPTSGGSSISGNSVPPIPEADQATSLDSAMVPGDQPGAEQSAAQPMDTQQANAQQPAMSEPEPEVEQPPPVKEAEPDPVPVKKVKPAKKTAAKKQPPVEAVENVEQADYSDADAAGPEPLVLVPPGQPVASSAEQTQPQPEQQPVQKSRSFFDFGAKSEGVAQKRTGKAAEQIGLNESETAVNTNYANARQPKAAEEQVASLAPEPEAQQPIPEPEPEAQQSAPEQPKKQQQSAPEPKKQPQQAAISGYIAQLASFRSEAEALAEYDRLLSRHGSLLSGLAPRVTKAFVTGSHRYRLGVGPLASRAEASKLCSNLIAAGERDCLVRAN